MMGNVYVMAGVPSIMRAMFDAIEPTLSCGKPVITKTIQTTLVESVLAPHIEEVEVANDGIEVGSYPSFYDGKWSVSVVVRGFEEGLVDLAANQICEKFKALGDEPTLSNR